MLATLPSITWQNQRAFQKQDCIFVGKKRVLGKAKKGIREQRYFKTVGLGIKTPRAAIDGTYVDKKCPWTGAPTAHTVVVVSHTAVAASYAAALHPCLRCVPLTYTLSPHHHPPLGGEPDTPLSCLDAVPLVCSQAT